MPKMASLKPKESVERISLLTTSLCINRVDDVCALTLPSAEAGVTERTVKSASPNYGIVTTLNGRTKRPSYPI